jgi:tRNA pseudouridine32 synthase/23S rRNA pseudouridine746 synthase
VREPRGAVSNPVFTHPDFYIFDKPAGVSFHSESGTGFFADICGQHPGETLFPVHRLDRLTSGLVLIARHKTAAQDFGKLFETHAVAKTYVALSDHKPLKKQGAIIGDMQRSRSGNWKLARSKTNPAITRFTSQATDLLFNEKTVRLFVLKPQTGKTHQLRVMMKAIAAPIIGDERYGGTPADRGYLHASVLEFTWQGEKIYCEQQATTGNLFLSP